MEMILMITIHSQNDLICSYMKKMLISN